MDATSPTGPYNVNESTQSANVKTYFETAGVPSDQVGEVQATYQSGLMGGSVAERAPMQFTLESITPILRRRISGVLVVESEAWAKMNANGDVEMECVFWPSLDKTVVDQAVAWSQSFGNTATHAAFTAKLGLAVTREVGIVIHHSDRSVHSQPVAYASYDAVIGSEASAAARHFDENGIEFRLPQEIAPAPTSVPTRSGR
jgi:hypothetical protein